MNGRAHELNQVLKLKEMWCHRDDYGGFLGSLTTYLCEDSKALSDF